jgi:uncharacterized protein YkwD
VLSSLAVLATTAPAEAARTDCAPEPGWPGQNADLAMQVVTLVNQHRATIGLGPVSVSQTLTDAATWKAAQLAADVPAYGQAAFAHEDFDPATGGLGRTPPVRMQACGWGSAFGENIAFGQRSSADVMRDWLNSPGHRANIERAGWVAIGVGAVPGAGGIGWVQEFGDQNPDPIATPIASLVPPTASPTTPTVAVPLAPPVEAPSAAGDAVTPGFAPLGLQIMDRPRSRTRKRTAKFRWAIFGEAHGIECRLNGKTLKRCGSTGRTLRVRRGRHVLRVTVKGPAGEATQLVRWRVLRG